MLSDAEEAQDVAQETFIRLWKSGQAGSDPDTLLAWAYRTSTNLAIDRLRQRGLRARNAPEAQPQPSQEAQLSAQQQLQQVADRLPQQDLQLLVLERVDGLTQAEVAGVLGTSHRTVRRLFGRAYERLARAKRDLDA